MRRFNRVLQMAVIGSLCFGVSALPGWAKTFQSQPKQTALIELFSSEGCSSCPPADAWMNGLKDSPGLWKDFVPAAFHVDYWDYLGWKDPYGSRQFSNRQRDYASRWRRPSVYTPGVIVNGKEWSKWYRGESYPGALAQNAGVVVAETSAGEQTVIFKPVSENLGALTAHSAVLGFGLVSKVRSGENRGKTLKHDFVVMQYDQKPMIFEKGQYRAKFNLKAEPRPGEDQALIAWVTQSKNPIPIQSTGGYL